MIPVLLAEVGQSNQFAFQVPEWIGLQTFSLAHLFRKSGNPHFMNMLSPLNSFSTNTSIIPGKAVELSSDMSKNNFKFG